MQEAFALHRQGKLREAGRLYSRVLKAAPDTFDALNLLGTLKAQSGKFGEAYRLLSSAVKVMPQAPEAWLSLAQVLHALKRENEALECLEKAVALRPDFPEAQHNRGVALLALGRAQDAVAAFDTVLARHPNHVDARLNRAGALSVLGRNEEALKETDAALAAAPTHPNAHYNRGNILFALGRFDEAPAAFSRALELAPDNILALNNRGRALQALNRHREALADFERTIALQKDYADGHFNASLALLTLGELERGFAEYEWRWKRTGMAPFVRSRGRPLWLGEYPLGRKTILLHAEQGLGDTIQFARYIPRLAKGGANVVLEVHAELVALMKSVEGVTACVARGDPLPPYDVHCPMGSLPLALRTTPQTVPADIPYLRADETRLAAWRTRLDAVARPRVAIAWAGQPSHQNDRNRSIALERLAPLFEHATQSFVSIQRELRESDAAVLARFPNVVSLGHELNDMADTAAVLALCDLTLTVDTSVAHLAGAMGRPLWVMIPFVPDWRWTLDGERSPWYPEAKLFRQPAIGGWDSVIARLRDALSSLAAPA